MVKLNFSSGAHQAGICKATNQAMATMSRALSARAEQNCAAIRTWKPRGKAIRDGRA